MKTLRCGLCAILLAAAVTAGAWGCAEKKDAQPARADGPSDAAGTMAHDDGQQASAELKKQQPKSPPPPPRDDNRGRGAVDQPLPRR